MIALVPWLCRTTTATTAHTKILFNHRHAARTALEAYPGGLQLGGGVNADNAVSWLDAGASHVIVTSFVFSDGQLQTDRLASLVNLVGAKRLVLDLSCRHRDGRYYVVTDRWQVFRCAAGRFGVLYSCICV